MAPKNPITAILWLAVALAIVFAPALDSDRDFGMSGLAGGMDARILAPSAYEGVAREDRSLNQAQFRRSMLPEPGAPSEFVLPALVAVSLVAVSLAALSKTALVTPVTYIAAQGSRGPPIHAS